MRDLQQLEELSSTAALGLWADDVVMALDRAARESPLTASDTELLQEASALVDRARAVAEEPFATSTGAGRLGMTDSTLSAAASLFLEEPSANEEQFLSDMAGAIQRAADQALTDIDHPIIRRAAELFARVSQAQLVRNASVLTSRKGVGAWTAIPAISIS